LVLPIATVAPVAYPDDLLVPGEQIVMHKHPHWKMLILPVVVLLVVVGAGAFSAALVRAQAWAPWGWLAVGVVDVGLIARFTLWPVLRWRTTHFVLTTRRVLVRDGVLSRQGIDIPMSRINSVQFRHTLVERILGCGTLVIESASEEPLEFDDVPGVERVHALLYREVADEH
jgi:uncharacterized membrane protein YdbT with pleckstrin-like domain